MPARPDRPTSARRVGRSRAALRAQRRGIAARWPRCPARSASGTRKNCWNTKPIAARANAGQRLVRQAVDRQARPLRTAARGQALQVPAMASMVDLPRSGRSDESR